MFCNETVTAMSKLEITYNNRYRRLLGTPKYNSES